MNPPVTIGIARTLHWLMTLSLNQYDREQRCNVLPYKCHLSQPRRAKRSGILYAMTNTRGMAK